MVGGEMTAHGQLKVTHLIQVNLLKGNDGSRLLGKGGEGI